MENDAVFFNKETGKVITTLNTVKSSSIYVTGGNGNPRIPRKYSIKNTTGNEDFYNALLKHIGGKFRMESDQINGLFEVSLEGDEIILNEFFN
jgi:hypothetical protein